MSDYTVIAGDAPMFETNDRKQAIQRATHVRNRDHTDVAVIDAEMRVVYYKPAPRAITQIPKYTRVVELPDGLEAPEGTRVAYLHRRNNGAILFNNETRRYQVMDLSTGKVLRTTYPTAAAAGARISEGVGRARKKISA